MNDPLRGCPTCGTKVDDANLGLRDYRWVSDALPGRIAPMDIDFVLERHGSVLIMEQKPKGAPIPLGQRMSLRTFARMPNVEVWIAWNNPGERDVEVGAMDRRGEVPFIERMQVPKLKHRVAEWLEAQE